MVKAGYFSHFAIRTAGFEQALAWRAVVGLLLILAGVVLVNSFVPHE